MRKLFQPGWLTRNIILLLLFVSNYYPQHVTNQGPSTLAWGTTKAPNARSTQPLNAHSTQPLNAHSNPALNSRPTQALNAHSNQALNARSTPTLDAPSMQAPNARSTQAPNARSSQAPNARPTSLKAFIIDDRLSALRRKPGLKSQVIRRLRLGHAVYIMGTAKADPGEPRFYRIAVTRRTRGWIHESALAV